jgi:hypothetical protein
LFRYFCCCWYCFYFILCCVGGNDCNNKTGFWIQCNFSNFLRSRHSHNNIQEINLGDIHLARSCMK